MTVSSQSWISITAALAAAAALAALVLEESAEMTVLALVGVLGFLRFCRSAAASFRFAQAKVSLHALSRASLFLSLLQTRPK